MLEPSSPARVAKEKGKAKATVEEGAKVKPDWPRMKRGHVPSNDSVVRQLSFGVTDKMLHWWEPYRGRNGEFAGNKKGRGDPNGAAGWLRHMYIGEFWDIHYPNAKGASKDDKLWFLKQEEQQKRIWSFLDNSTRPLAAEGKVRQRAIAHDVYREEQPAAYDAAVEEWKQAHGSAPSLPVRRQLSYQVYKDLPNQGQHDYMEKAVAKVKDSRQFARITDPKKLAAFTQDYKEKVQNLLKWGFEHGGIDGCLFMVYQTEEGKTRVTRELTEGISDFSETAALAGCMDGLKGFLEAANKPATYVVPSPRVYPDLAKDGYPCLPNFQGWSLKRLQKLLRDFFVAMFKFQGGVGRLMWKELKEAMEYYFEKRRLPKVEGLVLDDPSNLAKKMVLTWLHYFLATLTGALPPEEDFQFLRIFAGSSPIHQSESQETRREPVERDGKVGYFLVFEDKVTKCHRVGGMVYKQAAIDFANHVAFGTAHVNADSAPPVRWLSLPTAGPNVSTIAFSEEELDLISPAPELPETAKTRVLSFIEAVTAYQEHLPAMHPLGIWLLEGGIPLVFARNPQEASRPWVVFWLAHAYFLPPAVAPPEGTLYFFEVFQDKLREGDMMLHQPSKTFYGGYTGVVSMARALIQIYYNCLAVRGDFKPPEVAPAGYDTSRFNVQELGRIEGWIDKWISTIKQHTKILSETSAERKAGLARVITQPISKVPDGEDSRNSDSDSDGSRPNTSRAPISWRSPSPSLDLPTSSIISPLLSVDGPSNPPRPPQSTPGPSKSSKGKQREVSRLLTDDDETEDDGAGEDVDYDGLDITSQDGQSSNDEQTFDDDIFPPEDSIGILERYGFKLDFKLGSREACNLPTSEDLWTPEMSEIWGGFPELAPYKAPRLSCAKSMISQLIALGNEAEHAISRWENYNKDNHLFIQEIQQRSKKEASGFTEPFRPIVQFLLIRLWCWLRAKAMAPDVFDQWVAMSYILREAIYLFGTAERFIKNGAFPDPESTPANMIDQVKKAKLLVVSLRFTCAELRSWYDLSRDSMQILQGSWLIREIPPLGDAIEIIDGLLKWVYESTALSELIAKQRPESWETFVDAPYDDLPTTSYVFGCATREEVPKGLKAALREVRKMDLNTNIKDQITRSIEGIPAGHNIAPLASEEPSPSHPASAATTPPESNRPPPASKRTPTTEMVTKPVVVLVPDHSAQCGQGTDVDMPVPATGAPSTESGVKGKGPNSRSKPQATGSREPQVVELPLVVAPAPLFATGGSKPGPPTPVDTVEGTQVMTMAPIEDNSPPAEPLPSVPADPLSSAPSRSSRSKTKSKLKDLFPSPSLPSAPPIQPTTEPESTQLRKRKSAPETETETEKGQEKRTSARLQAKSGPEKAVSKSKGGKVKGKVSKHPKPKH